MKRRCVLLTVLLSSLFVVPFAGARALEDIRDLRRAFLAPPDDCRPMMRWWWFGPAVTKVGLEREMRLMKEGGIGGFEVEPVYPLAPDDDKAGFRNLPYLSSGFLEALGFAAGKARELGLRFDLTLGSGWPYGGPGVSISDAAPRLRWERVKVVPGARRVPVPDPGPGEQLLAAFDAGTGRELTDVTGGILRLPDGASPVEVWFFISGRTGQQVKRAAVGAEGYVVDHYSRPALERFLANVAEPLLRAAAPNPPYAIFCDSLEVYGSDWSGDFLEQFRSRRGYDLKPRLPALAANSAESAGLRHDWGKTLTELLEERFLAPLQQWAKAHGTLLRIQGYGVPPAALSSNAFADLAEGEGHQWKRLTASRWASSANHLYGRAVTSSETWTWLHSPAFRATPLDLKVEADRHFLQGVNQLIGHGWPYTPEGTPYPGGRFYAAGVFNDSNPWWIVMPDLSRYLQRLSFLLRQGKAVNDVALYLPNSDAWAHFALGRVNLLESLGERIGPAVVESLLSSGYGVDFVDDRALEQLGRIDRASLQLGGNRYRAIVLPGVETMPLATVRMLEELARAGGVVVATRRLPARVPGFSATLADTAELRETVRRLFEAPSHPGHFVAAESALGGALAPLLQPDVSFVPPVPGIGFVHRSLPTAEVYFLANTDNVRHRVEAAFRVEGLQPECWDPVTGGVLPIEVLKRSPGSVSVVLDLEPYGSRAIVFAPGQTPPAAALTRSSPAPIDLSRGWQVRFGDGAAVRMDRLRSWTEDEATRYFSGLAAYEKTFEVQEPYLSAEARPHLSLGAAIPLAEEPARGRRPAPAGAAAGAGPGSRGGGGQRETCGIGLVPALRRRSHGLAQAR